MSHKVGIPEEAIPYLKQGLTAPQLRDKGLLTTVGTLAKDRTLRRWYTEFHRNNYKILTSHEPESSKEDKPLNPFEKVQQENNLDDFTISHGWMVQENENGDRVSLFLKADLNKQLQSIKEEFSDWVESIDLDLPVIEPLHIDGKYCVIISLYDVHMNKRDVDHTPLTRQIETFEAVINAIIAKIQLHEHIGYVVDRIIFVVGNDLFQTDNNHGTTTKGTQVAFLQHPSSALQPVVDMIIRTILKLSSIAPVTVPIVPSNHDFFTVVCVGMMLDYAFKDNPYVEILGGDSPRKYYAYGQTSWMFRHGDKGKPEDTVGAFIKERPEFIGRCHYREVHQGHDHKWKVKSHSGIVFKSHPALTEKDAWHDLHEMVGSDRAATYSYYHYEDGPDKEEVVFVREVDKVNESIYTDT